VDDWRCRLMKEYAGSMLVLSVLMESMSSVAVKLKESGNLTQVVGSRPATSIPVAHEQFFHIFCSNS
jgi:hypothetical protein